MKKAFSEDPIDFDKIRKGDLHIPKGKFFKDHQLQRFTISETTITEIGTNKETDKLLIFIHGGAFISGPSQIHWDTIKEIATHTKFKIWMCDYPKAPENKITKISNNIDSVYERALDNFPSNRISFIGDSVGGTLIVALIQRLIIKKTDLPKKIILVSPVMDASMCNPEIEKIDPIDPMLSRAGVLSAKRMCAGDIDLKNQLISPLFGSFENFPSTILYLAENDITFPDQKLAAIKMTKANISIELHEGKNMPHIWPFLPIMPEAKKALSQIINTLNS